MRHSLDLIGRRLLSRSRVNPETALVNGCHCREWLGARRDGYGRLWDGERLADAHRLSREVATGAAPKDRVLHRCDNPPCIEQVHLWEGSPADNTADMIEKGRHLAGRVVSGLKHRGVPSEVRGEIHPKAKLTQDDVRAIKRRLAMKKTRANRKTVIAREYGVSESLIRGIEMGRNWSWL